MVLGMYVNMLVDGRKGDVHSWDIPDQRCAEWQTLISPLCTFSLPKAHQTAFLSQLLTPVTDSSDHDGNRE